jgi:nitrite reductase/ring-hydroxylating ferredoxin subunit
LPRRHETIVRISKVDHNDRYVFAANLSEIQAAGGCLYLQIQKQTITLFYYNSKVYAIDNRCPHMGFPLNRGTVKDGILTCHWHHARFDLNSGGTFDQWSGDVRSFPVEIRNENDVWIDVSSHSLDPFSSHQLLLETGLKQNISLMIAKAVIGIVGKTNSGNKNNNKDNDAYLLNAFRTGLDFGSHYKQSGWGQGLTVLTCMMNIIPYLDMEDRSYALYHGLSAVAQDCASMPPRFEISPLPFPWPDLSTLKRWFRQFIESRDAQAAERCIVTALRAGANSQQMADMLFAAATDHRFLDVGHILDFTNKALEAFDMAGWDDNKALLESVLTSLASGYANAERMEESSSWRYPIDLIAILENAFKELPIVLENGSRKRASRLQEIKDNNKDGKLGQIWSNNSNQKDALVTVLLSDDPQSIVDVLFDALNQGATEEELACSVCYAAALRIAQFHTRNEFTDWDATLHTFTFANAVHQGLGRIATPELLRGVFDAAMRVYLNRFLNIPSISLTEKPRNEINDKPKKLEIMLKDLTELLDKQQQVNEAGRLVANYLYSNGADPLRLMAVIGKLLLREDRNFHSIQMIEAAFRQCSLISNDDTVAKVNILVAATRYLAAHSPTMRSQGRTYQIANQLYHGQHLFEEE